MEFNLKYLANSRGEFQKYIFVVIYILYLYITPSSRKAPEGTWNSIHRWEYHRKDISGMLRKFLETPVAPRISPRNPLQISPSESILNIFFLPKFILKIPVRLCDPEKGGYSDKFYTNSHEIRIERTLTLFFPVCQKLRLVRFISEDRACLTYIWMLVASCTTMFVDAFSVNTRAIRSECRQI